MHLFRRFIVHCLIIAIIPMAALAAVYAVVDPFKVLHSYSDYYPGEASDPAVALNQSVVTVNNYLNHGLPNGANAFLMGSSVSGYIPAEAWQRHLPDSARVFHFYSSWESIRSMMMSLRMLERHHSPIDHVVITMIPTVYGKDRMDDPVLITDPHIDTERSKAYFHWVFVKGFYHRDFIRSYLAGVLTRHGVDVRNVVAYQNQDTNFDPLTNEETHPQTDSLMRADIDRWVHFNRRATPLPPGQFRMHRRNLGPQQRQWIEEIASIFERNHTDYHVVIPPSAGRDIPHPDDLHLLQATFGQRLHDLSRQMAWASDVDSLWYDDIHFTPALGAQILDRVYR